MKTFEDRTNKCTCPRCGGAARYWWRRVRGKQFAQFVVYCEACFGQMPEDVREMPKRLQQRRINRLRPLESAEPKPSMFATRLSLPDVQR